MAHNARSDDLRKKKAAKEWLHGHPEPKREFNRVLESLRSCYRGSDFGYIDLSRSVEYRMGGPRGKNAYLIIVGQVRQVRVKVSLDGSAAFEHFKILPGTAGDAALQNVIEFLRENRASDFDTIALEEASSRQLHQAEAEFQARVAAAQRLSREKLEAKAKEGADDPAIKELTVKVRARNPFVVALRLSMSEGRCELKGCQNPVPFSRDDGSTFLEVHHKKPLSEGGPDRIENTIALCPNCHRWWHYRLAERKRKRFTGVPKA
jgi:hypothetical protein